MSSEKIVSEQLNEFKKFILNLENIDVQIDDGDQVLLFLCSLPKMHDHFKEILLNWRETLSLSLLRFRLH